MIYISKLADIGVIEYLKEIGKDLFIVEDSPYINSPISSHPDLRYVRLTAFDNVSKDNSSLFIGDETLLGSEYPKDCIYNSCVLGKYIIASKYTSQTLIESSKRIPIIVPQGYVKCNLLIVDDNHVITEDEGIYRKLKNYDDIFCLLVSPGFVALPGYKHGFLGGASGRVGDEIIFNGNIYAHPDYNKIEEFIKKQGLKIKGFSYALEDIGSIIEE